MSHCLFNQNTHLHERDSIFVILDRMTRLLSLHEPLFVVFCVALLASGPMRIRAAEHFELVRPTKPRRILSLDMAMSFVPFARVRCVCFSGGGERQGAFKVNARQIFRFSEL